MDIINKYFPHLTPSQSAMFSRFMPLYVDFNARVNVISRRDIENLHERHVLSSLGLARIIHFKDGTSVLDAGTGGGFPGIPLAIFFPEVKFHLVDSIGKKVKVVSEVAESLGLKNVTVQKARMEHLSQQFDFIVSRAVAPIPKIVSWTKGKIRTTGFNDLPNGLFYLKGGDFEEELEGLKKNIRIWELNHFFEEPFFETKKVVHIW